MSLAEYLQHKRDLFQRKQTPRVPEHELCSVLVSHLRSIGYETYQEVEQIFGRADIVAVKDDKQWAIEVKQSAGQDLIQQVLRWHDKCDYVSVAVFHTPKPKTRRLFDKLGIGILQINKHQINIIRSAKLSPLAKGLILFEEQKNNEAGHKSAKCWFPSKTQRKIIKTHISKSYGPQTCATKQNKYRMLSKEER